MTTTLTLRVPNDLINEVNRLFHCETKTESFLKAIRRGVESQKYLKEKMIADYSSITEEESCFIKDSAVFDSEILSDEDFSEYLKYL